MEATLEHGGVEGVIGQWESRINNKVTERSYEKEKTPEGFELPFWKGGGGQDL